MGGNSCAKDPIVYGEEGYGVRSSKIDDFRKVQKERCIAIQKKKKGDVDNEEQQHERSTSNVKRDLRKQKREARVAAKERLQTSEVDDQNRGGKNYPIDRNNFIAPNRESEYTTINTRRSNREANQRNLHPIEWNSNQSENKKSDFHKLKIVQLIAVFDYLQNNYLSDWSNEITNF